MHCTRQQPPIVSEEPDGARLKLRAGFPLMVEAFEGNTATTPPTIRAFMAAHQLADVTVVADAGMVSAANKAIEAAQLSFPLGTRIPDIPYVVTQWRREHSDGQGPPRTGGAAQPGPAGPSSPVNQIIYYQYKADRARRTLHGIDEQVTKAGGGGRKDTGQRNRLRPPGRRGTSP